MKFRALFSLLLVSLLLTLGACDSPEQAAPETTAPEAAAETEAAETPAETVTDAADLAAVEQSVEESIAEEAEAEADDPEAIELTPEPTAARTDEPAWKYQEGTHFRRLTTSQGTSSAPDKIEVAEMFWYGCGHCANFEPIFNQWKASAAADIAVVKIPVIWGPVHEMHGRIMYTAEALGVLDKVHPAVFEAIHQKNKSLTTDEEIVALFSEAGVDEAAFREAYKSFGVTSALKRAENLTRRYGIRSTPIMVVNGKYVVEGEGVRSLNDILAITEELAERERRDR